MSLAKKVIYNTLIQVAGKFISTIIGLFVVALITRYLGLSAFGEYTTIITFVTFFAVIADFGMTLVTAQMISGDGTNENKIINNLFGLRLISSILILSLAPLILIFFPYGPAIKTGVVISLVAFFFPALNQVIVGLFQKKLSLDRDVMAELAGRLALVGGVIIAKKLGLGLNGILLATVAAAAINFICHYLFALKFMVIKTEFDWLIWKKIISKSWPMAVTIILNLIYLRADTLMLSLFRNANEVGLYGVTYRVIDVITTLPFMFAGLIMPLLTASWLKNEQSYFKKILQKSFDFMAIAAIPIVIGAQFLGEQIMTLIAGPDFAAAGRILQILVFAVAAIFLGAMFSHAVIALDKQKKMIGFYVFTGFSSLVAYLVLIPKFSYFGAAAVTIYSEVMIAIFSAYCVFKYSRFLPNLRTTLKSLGAGLIMGAFLYFFPIHCQNSLVSLSLTIVSGGLVYSLFLFILKGVGRQDLEIIFKRQDKSGSQIYGQGSNL